MKLLFYITFYCCNYTANLFWNKNTIITTLFPGEDKFLQQLAIEEQFGVTVEEKEMQKEKLHERKGMGAAIGYNYNDPGAQPSGSNGRFSFTFRVRPQSAVMFDAYLCLVTG